MSARSSVAALRGRLGHTPTPDLAPYLADSLAWLARSQDVAGGGGSAKAFSFLRGWLTPYPETSGYIAPTFYDYAVWTGDSTWADRAKRMVEWTVEVQLPSGAVRGGEMAVSPQPIVFNTGQNLFGFLRAWAETGDESFLAAAKRAGDFLVAHQDDDGAWRRAAYAGIPHAYHARVAWPMLQLHRATGDERYELAGRRNLAWVISRQDADGWFRDNAFRPGQLPNTHGIAYVTQSLVEAGMLVDEPQWLDAAARTIDTLTSFFEERGWIPGFHGPGWTEGAKSECVTGNIQLALSALRLRHARGESLESVDKLIGHVTEVADALPRRPDLQGGIPGSWPVYGRYAPLQCPNWAAKFWADLLLLRLAIADPSHAGSKLVTSFRYFG